jgi:hypothetical protein
LMGEEREIELPGLSTGLDLERFRDKTQQFQRASRCSEFPGTISVGGPHGGKRI